jgi:L-alanine-DL-glutamate epimerase-like enolase superfamily enzyme
MSSQPPTVSRIEARTCVFPLARPFSLGRARISAREYVVVEITDSDGATGSSFALTRGAPTASVIADLVGPRFLDREYDDVATTSSEVARSLQPHAAEGLVGRAMSLVDIALWDLKGQREEAPVWQLLGAARDSAPAMIVEGYPIEGESPIAFADRLLRRVDEGYTFLKLAFGATDPQAFTARLRLLMDILPPHVKVSVDAAWTWYDQELGRQMLDEWGTLDLAWVEDPVAADEIETLRAFKRYSKVPLGVGDEVARPRTLIDAADSGTVDVVRVDVTCAGGYSRFSTIAAAAESRGLLVSTHVYPELHTHAELGAATAGPVEHFSPESPWDTSARFVQPTLPVVRDGVMTFERPRAPGLGLIMDRARINKATVQHKLCTSKRTHAPRRKAVEWR